MEEIMKTKNKYSIRKISAGTASVLIGSLLFLSPQISADELTDEEYEVNEESLVDDEVIVEQNAFEDQLDEKNKEVSTSISEDYNETPNLNDILNEPLENDEPTLDTQTDEVLSQEEETIDDQLVEEKVSQEESAEEDNGEMFDISNEKELEDRELSHGTQADEVLTQDEELVDLHLVDKVELQVESSVKPNEETIDNDIEEEMNDTEVIFEEDPVEVEDTGEVIVEEVENEGTEIHNENISNEILIEGENVEEEVLNNASFKIGEEQDLESGTYEFQFDASLSHDAEINIHNSEGVLIDSFNIRENTNYRTWNVSLVLKEGDSVEVIGAEATTKKIDDIYTEYVEPRDIFKDPHR